MKNIKFLLLAAVLGIFTLSAESFAQCVQCKRSATKSGGNTCQGATSGARECVSDGVTCTITGICGYDGFADSTCAESVEKNRNNLSVQIEETLLREIAAKHPRFAVALSSAAKVGFINEGTKVHILPIEFTKVEFENWLEFKQGDQSSQTFNKFGAAVQKLKRSIEDLPSIIYSVKAQPLSESAILIRLDVENAFLNDPAYSSLEVTLVKTKDNALEGKAWKVENWQLK